MWFEGLLHAAGELFVVVDGLPGAEGDHVAGRVVLEQALDAVDLERLPVRDHLVRAQRLGVLVVVADLAVVRHANVVEVEERRVERFAEQLDEGGFAAAARTDQDEVRGEHAVDAKWGSVQLE